MEVLIGDDLQIDVDSGSSLKRKGGLVVKRAKMLK